jgi:fatty-acyl-CoA synthase
MAAIATNGALDLAGLRSHLIDRLPGYARPLFLRILGELPATGTFKHPKHELARDGCDPDATSDALYFNDGEEAAFVRLDKELYHRIQKGEVRL